MLQSTEVRKRARQPKAFKTRTLVLSGYGISIRINDKKLQIKKQPEQVINRIEIRNGDSNLPQETYFTEISDRWHEYDRIVISGSGYVTFDALKWLTELGISVIMLDKKGKLIGNLNHVEGNTKPLIRKKQYACFDDFNKKLTLQKWVISHKITSEIVLLGELQLDTAWIENRLSMLPFANKLDDVSQIEAQCANMYYSSLAKLPDFHKHGFRGRTRKGASLKNEADNVINALFNYGYTILQTEIAKNLYGIGLDCNLGFMHKSHERYTPLIWDMMEPFRHLIDRSVIAVARGGISDNDYTLEREELLFSYPYRSKNPYKTWLIMKNDLTVRLIREIDTTLQKEYWTKGHVGRKTESGHQKMLQTTIMKEFCLELRDYILERKKSLSQPQKLLAR
jgi:CRISPR-associated protein Cas1